MKFLVVVALLVSCTTIVAGQCLEVKGGETPETVRISPSSENARITLLLDGRPQKNAKLTVSLPGGHDSQLLVTDSHGIVVLRDLPVGISCVSATAGNNVSSEMCLEVSAHFPIETSSFQMTLVTPGTRPNSFDERVKGTEKRAPTFRLKALAGTVLDPSGAVIPKAEIQIYKRGSYPGEPTKTLETNEIGRFSVSLKPGMYTVMVRMNGFRTELQGVEISPDGKGDELRPMLQLQATDTCE